MLGVVIGALCVTPLVLGYLAFVRWADRFAPEPWWVIAAAFGWGAIFATLGGGLSSVGAERVVTAVAPGLADFAGTVIFAPVFEELFKAFGVALLAWIGALRRRTLQGPLDGAIFGGVVGLGFTLTEDVLYVAKSHAESGLGGAFWLVFLRTVLLGLSHCTFTACTGLGFGIASETRRTLVKIGAPWIGFGCAILMHAVHNLLTRFGIGGLALMILTSWVIFLGYFALLAGLVVRDRHILVRELVTELGHLVHPLELRVITSYFEQLPRPRGRPAIALQRQKRGRLVELAFVKRRLRLGDRSPLLLQREAALRAQIRAASQQGIWIGAPVAGR